MKFQVKLVALLIQAAFHLGQALWWQASTLNGTAQKRKIFHGTLSSNGPELTDDEKVEDAMNASNRHLESISNCHQRALNLYREK